MYRWCGLCTRQIAIYRSGKTVILKLKMRIHRVAIKNFRSLKDVAIDFDDVTTFIGPNGTGKSSILRGLDWFFNGSKSGDLTEDDCSFGAIDTDIEVEVTFGDLTAADRTQLGKYAPAGVSTFTAWKKRTPEGDEYLSANAKGFPPFSAIKSAQGVNGEGGKKELYNALRESRSDLSLPIAATGPAIDAAITTWEAANTEQLENLAEALQTNFFGFNSGGKMSGLFDFVLVTADLRAAEESQDAKSSIIGRILERTIDRTAADEEIGLIVESSRVAQQKVYDERFKAQLKVMTTSLNAVVDSYSPGRSVSVTPSIIELKPPRTTFDVAVVDGDATTAVNRQGHGFQRTLLISALQVLAQSGAASEEGVICLAIEEPELFQHPIQAQAFAKVLRSLAENANQKIQVTYATHSPYFIEASKFHQVRRLTRTGDREPVVTIHHSSISDVKVLLADAAKPAVVDRQLDGTVSARLSVAIFANRVLLVEGTTEVAVAHGIADRTNIGQLETLGISVVEVGGKTNLPLAHAILTSLGIPTYSMFDGDAGFETRARAAGKDEGKIGEERVGHVAANRNLLKYFGLTEEDFPSEQEAANVTVLEDHLEALMARDWAEWEVACLKLESEAGITLKKNQTAYRTATLEAEGAPSPLLMRVIEKTLGL